MYLDLLLLIRLMRWRILMLNATVGAKPKWSAGLSNKCKSLSCNGDNVCFASLSVCEASRCPRMAGKNASKGAGCVGKPVSPRRHAPKTKNGATKMNYAKEAAQCGKYDLATNSMQDSWKLQTHTSSGPPEDIENQHVLACVRGAKGLDRFMPWHLILGSFM